MKKLFSLTILAFCFTSIQTKAQKPFNTMDSIDVNNINAAVLVHGDMFWDPAKGAAHCNFPANAPTNINFASALWMSGYDGSSQLHVAAQTYRQDGNDYWPGPLDASDTLTYSTSGNWAKIWKVNRSDIQSFQALTTHTTSNTPPMILTWPAKGNANAQGNGGAVLSITNDMAPFVDLNHNGIYEPLLGEYPDIPGDQALWWVFSDNGPTHTQSNGKPLGVEVHAMAYGYNRGTLIDNVIYYDYKVINRSPNTYTNFRLGLWDDVDLGRDFDDFIGFDSTHRMGIVYNGVEDDGGGSGGGHPANSYGRKIPIAGITMVVLPGDIGTSYVPAGSFMYYNNDFSIIGNPSSDTVCNCYMRSMISDGKHIKNDFKGAGMGSTGYGPGPDCNYLFTGDPSDSSQWSECSAGNMPGDRRFIITSNDFTSNPGSVQNIVMALVTTNPDTLNGCPLSGFAGIKTVADTAWEIYHNPLPPNLVPISKVSAGNAMNIYPNPAHDKLYIENTGNCIADETITIYNTLGQVVYVPINNTGQKSEADISQLPCGLYNILYRKGNMQTTARFVKE